MHELNSLMPVGVKIEYPFRILLLGQNWRQIMLIRNMTSDNISRTSWIGYFSNLNIFQLQCLAFWWQICDSWCVVACPGDKLSNNCTKVLQRKKNKSSSTLQSKKGSLTFAVDLFFLEENEIFLQYQLGTFIFIHYNNWAQAAWWRM